MFVPFTRGCSSTRNFTTDPSTRRSCSSRFAPDLGVPCFCKKGPTISFRGPPLLYRRLVKYNNRARQLRNSNCYLATEIGRTHELSRTCMPRLDEGTRDFGQEFDRNMHGINYFVGGWRGLKLPRSWKSTRPSSRSESLLIAE